MSEEDILIDLAKRRVRAVKEGRASELEPILHGHYLYIDSDGRAFDKTAFLEAISNNPRPDTGYLEPEIVNIEIDGDFAQLVFEVQGDYWFDRRHRHGPIRTYHTLSRIDGQWVFIAGHYREFSILRSRPGVGSAA